MKSLFPFLFFLALIGNASAQKEDRPLTQWGISAAINYSFSGISIFANGEFQKGPNIFYAGPKFPVSRTYLPLKGPWGINLGYRYEYNKSLTKVVSFFFNLDYQLVHSRAFSQDYRVRKRNYVHEIFAGYGVQFQIARELYLANMMGLGAYYENYFNPDLDSRKSYLGYDNIIKFFINYRF